MNKTNILSDEEVEKINSRYCINTQDEFMKKRFINIEKSIPWKSVKNNTKKNKFRKNDNLSIHKPDPFKFMKIPTNLKQIIMDLCNKHGLSLQTLAVKCNLPLHIIDNYINNNYNIDNYELNIILKKLNFDLNDYIKQIEEDMNKL